MALTLAELETAYNSLTGRIEKLERLVANSISTEQLNGVSLLIEKDIQDLQSDVTTMQNQISALETQIEDLV